MAKRWNTRTAVRAGNLAGRGFAIETIAEQLGRSERSVQCALTRWSIAPGRAVEAIPIALSRGQRRQLAEHAQRRELSPQALAQVLIHLVLRDGLADAVLDDRHRARLGGRGGLIARAEVVRVAAAEMPAGREAEALAA